MKEHFPGTQGPFKEDLRPHKKVKGDSNDLLQFGGDSQSVIRSTTIESIRTEYGENLSAEQVAKKTSAVFSELESMGVKAPAVRTIGKDDFGKDAIYTISPLIKPASAVAQKSPEAFHEHIQLCKGLFNYFKQAYETKRDCLFDISLDQFIYGAKAGDTENHWYLVDVDPYFSKWGENILFNIAHLYRELHKHIGGNSDMQLLMTDIEKYLQDNPLPW